MNFREFLNDEYIERIRIPEDRDYVNGLRCNRNERVSIWDKNFIQKLMSDIDQYDMTLYPDLSKIYDAIAKHEALKKENILIGSGIDGIIKNIFETFTHEGMKIGVLSPTYAMYYVYSKLFKTELRTIGYDYQNFKLDRRKLRHSLSEVSILFIPNPNQPVEDNLDLKEMGDLALECNKRNILIVFDEAYFGFGCDSAKSLIKKFDNVIVMRTFSKAFGMPSIRVGYMMSNENLTKRIAQKRISYETNTIGQKIAINLLNYTKYVDEYNSRVCESREEIKKELEKYNYVVNAHKSNFMLIKFNSKKERDEKNIELLKSKIYTKANYQNEMSDCMLVTLGPFSDMIPLVQELKKGR